MLQRSHPVVEGQHGPLLSPRFFLLNQKQRSQHDQGHVVMPGIPAADLVVGHAAFAFRFAKAVLNEEALRLYSRKFLPGGIQGCIG
jgi:hypothetical protein